MKRLFIPCLLLMATITASAQEATKKPVKEKPKVEVTKFTPPKIVKSKEVTVENKIVQERKPEPTPPPPPPKMKKPGNGKMTPPPPPPPPPKVNGNGKPKVAPPPPPPPPKVKKAAKAPLPKVQPANKAE